ncbi:hypothetical protein QNA08_06360 [Chelatococcus sp. SYSU_G07232]|uniref:CoxF protein n=1 Tax=Chelatococcus albus TaxID=3047466 RepID=A0ABT7AES5_9HYPH|nr:hypothetical protein [Chelatococcus sp. SYSU_G07232]MDJ1157853.1 hypothetical protein [Chelatococcus sp. SYSU_G07232]
MSGVLPDERPEKAVHQPSRPEAPERAPLTPEEVKRRRARNLAIALTLGALCVLFYAVTIARLGVNVLNRPL